MIDKKNKPYSYEIDGKVFNFSLEEFRRITDYRCCSWNTKEQITLTIIDYFYDRNVFIAKTDLEKVPFFCERNGRFFDFYSGILAFDPFCSCVIWLEDEEYHAKEKALSCIGHTFTIPTLTSHSWFNYKGKYILEYYPSYEDIINTSWDGRLTKYCTWKDDIIEERFGG
jgi:hypothetical protein